MDDLKTINIGILAHVDAGKTTVTENLLYNGDIIKSLGNVDDKNTQTDTMELEKERGITIKSTAISFNYKDVKINILDTPGHMDFIAEVERALSVLDGAILVISSVEGVQSQTKIIFETLKRLKIPTIIFINKLDRMCSVYKRVFKDIFKYLSENTILMDKCNNETTNYIDIETSLEDGTGYDNAIDVLSKIDDGVLEEYLSYKNLTIDYLVDKIVTYTKSSMVYPVFLGSAILNIGTKKLLDNIITFLPINHANKKILSAVVFKIERTSDNEKKAYVRVFDGEINIRDMICINNDENLIKVKKLSILENTHIVNGSKIGTGDIGIVHGMQNLKIGDVIGHKRDEIKHLSIAKPTIKTQISLLDDEDNHFLYRALLNLSDEDPLLQIELDNENKSIYINLFGEVQKEIIEETLKRDYGLNVIFSNTQTIYKETTVSIGEAIMYFRKYPNIYNATIQLRVEPLPLGEGIKYKSEVTAGFLPKSFLQAIEDSVYTTCKHGLYGWELTDILVTLLYTEYDSVSSTPSDFRDLAPMVLMEAVGNAKTKLLEPVNEFELIVSENTVSKAMYDLKMMNALYEQPYFKNGEYLIKGTIPFDSSKNYQIKVLSYTEGKGLYTYKFHGYNETAFDESKVYKCKYISALNKKEYIMHKQKSFK